jgi:hypothetical protein
MATIAALRKEGFDIDDLGNGIGQDSSASTMANSNDATKKKGKEKKPLKKTKKASLTKHLNNSGSNSNLIA